MLKYKKTSRAIIFNESKDSIISIKRTKFDGEKEISTYYTFPGGHVEKGETYKETLVREVHEELNIKIEIINEIDTIFNNELKRKEKFFICKKSSGNISQGNGPEFSNPDYSKYGKYEIVELKINEIDKINLLPKKIKRKIINKFL